MPYELRKDGAPPTVDAILAAMATVRAVGTPEPNRLVIHPRRHHVLRRMAALNNLLWRYRRPRRRRPRFSRGDA